MCQHHVRLAIIARLRIDESMNSATADSEKTWCLGSHILVPKGIEERQKAQKIRMEVTAAKSSKPLRVLERIRTPLLTPCWSLAISSHPVTPSTPTSCPSNPLLIHTSYTLGRGLCDHHIHFGHHHLSHAAWPPPSLTGPQDLAGTTPP